MYCKAAAFSTSSCLRIPMLNLEIFSENKNAALICDHLGKKMRKSQEGLGGIINTV